MAEVADGICAGHAVFFCGGAHLRHARQRRCWRGAERPNQPATVSAGAGATSITLDASIGAGASIVAGDLLLVIQMQDAAINSSNTDSYGNGIAGDPGSGSTALNSAGLYEFVRATNAVGIGSGTVTLVGGSGGGLLNGYTHVLGSDTVAQRRFQVVRVPQYTTATLGSGLTATAWNGTAGGVLVFDVAGALTLGGATVSVNGLGMRGGGARQLGGGAGVNTDYRTLATVNNNGSKGEGIAGTPRYVNNGGALLNTGVEGYPNGSHARGAPGNAGGGGTYGSPGGNDQNTGGGGSNAGTGGKGGNAWSSASPTGGWGGFDYSGSVGPGRLFLGGGGGSGTTNNGTGTPGAGFASSGAAGGGLVMIRAGSITGSATISANGANANNTVTNDGSGGGAGGSVLVYSGGGSVGTLTVQATGGTGGTNTGGVVAHGPGRRRRFCCHVGHGVNHGQRRCSGYHCRRHQLWRDCRHQRREHDFSDYCADPRGEVWRRMRDQDQQEFQPNPHGQWSYCDANRDFGQQQRCCHYRHCA